MTFDSQWYTTTHYLLLKETQHFFPTIQHPIGHCHSRLIGVLQMFLAGVVGIQMLAVYLLLNIRIHFSPYIFAIEANVQTFLP